MSEHYLDEIAREHDAECEAEAERLCGGWDDEDDEDYDCSYCGGLLRSLTKVSNMCDACFDFLRADL